jgi:hypothetical protein
MFDAFFI